MADGQGPTDAIWLEQLDNDYRDAVLSARAYAQATTKVRSIKREWAGGLKVHPFAGVREVYAEELIYDAADALLLAMVSHAAQRFAVRGATLKVSTEAYRWILTRTAKPSETERLSSREPRAVRADFLPSQLWAVLRQDLESTGREASLRVVAAQLWSLFGLEHAGEVRNARGGMELRIATYTEAASAREGGGYRVSHTWASRRSPQLLALSAWLAHRFAGDKALCSDSTELVARLREIVCNESFHSRHKLTGKFMTAELFKDQIKLVVVPEIGAALSEFFSDYRDQG